ncbi:MAG: hypothetical protein MUC99_13515 [Anaerolineae bacterium]|nr:hypothetical protein [Anaerolineae bacterium]
MTRFSRLDLAVMGVGGLVVVLIIAAVLLVQPPTAPLRIAYLAPALGSPQNIWVAEAADPTTARQVTFSSFGVFDFAPSPDGRYIAYAERLGADVQYRVDLMLLDLFDGGTQRLTTCALEDANCNTPTWRADGRQIAYMRSNASPSGDGSIAPSKVWLIDDPLSANRQTYPLFNDNQTTGSSPVFSADGRRLAFYENVGGGVIVFDFNPPTESDRLKFIPADNGATGALSPDGERLVTSVLVMGGDVVRSGLMMADLVAGTTRSLLPDGESSDGIGAAWHPDGRRLAITRQYQDTTRYTNGHQVYEVDTQTDTLTPLLVDEAYTHGSLAYSPDGGLLVVQRYRLGGASPSIWVLDIASGQAREIAQDAYLPAWVPAITGQE